MAEIAFTNLPNELNTPADDDILGIDDTSASETKKIQVSKLLGGATQAEMGHVCGVTSGIQTQINAKAASGANADITSLTGVNLIDVDMLNLDDAAELTISAGAITITQSYHKIDTEAGAATDDLAIINDGIAGDVIFLCAENDARTVVLKHDDTAGAGKIVTATGADYSLDNGNKVVQLIYSSEDSHWHMVVGGADDNGGVADTTLSGTPKVFTVYDGSTPYYFKAYPTKA